MASASGSTDCSSGSSSSVPQWKRDLIQRRRQQNKVLASNGASVKLCTAVSGALSSSSTSLCSVDTSAEPVERLSSCISDDHHSVVASCVLTSRSRTTEDSSVDCPSSALNRPTQACSPSKSICQPSCGATCEPGCAALTPPCGERGNERRASAADLDHHSVARNMRLEADLQSSLLRSDDPRNNSIPGTVDFQNYENTDDNVAMRNYGNNVPTGKRANREQDCENGLATRIIRKIDEKTNVRVYASEQARKHRSRIEPGDAKSSNGKIHADGECESDSSEELQYGPGIVNRLKSKYLNLTLRETKSRVAVQRFRRAASLEDLLDCEHEDERNGEKTARKYAKRTTPSGGAKSERYRNPSRGNESMKRARSVEALMRYNAPIGNEENGQERLAALRREPVNDHIVLIDRTSVKIESRLGEPDTRPKAVNKPKRIKPLLAETERPPPDLVKTTMRLFEGSVKKLKPKGEVAVKVATFKTINDSYKAQAIKKVLPKPPVQPKPFVNGNAAKPSSPKKIILGAKPTAEVIESPDPEEHRREGVVTEPIVQSVSSVVSKFQRIEMAYSPTASPEPNYKLKFSPSPSPEPHATSKLAKSPPPPTSPRISSPGAPTSPKKDAPRLPTSPANGETLGRDSGPEVHAVMAAGEQDADHSPGRSAEDTPDDADGEDEEVAKNRLDEDARTTVTPDVPNESNVDGSRAISKSALENISKAGITMQYNFGDKSSTGKTYLPGVATHNGRKSESTENGETRNESDGKMASPVPADASACSSPISIDSINDEAEDNDEKICGLESNRGTKITERNVSPGAGGCQNEHPAKPIGAISSLALAKSSPVCPVNALQGLVTANEVSGKTATKQPKYEASPPQKQIGIIRPLVSTKTQQTQQNLSNRELEKNLINRVKSIEQPTKVVVSLKSADEIQPVKKNTGSPGGGLWDSKHWNSPNNTMVFNFSNRKDVPDYIENDGLIIRRKREKQKVGDGGVIVLDSTLDTASSDDTDWEISGGPPSPCDVSFVNDNVLINGRSNLSKQPRNHKHRIQFDDGATRTFEYPSEASILADEGTSVDGDSSSTGQQSSQGAANKSNSTSSASTMSSTLLGGGGLASFTPSKVDLASEGFELGVTRSAVPAPPTSLPASGQTQEHEEYLKSDEDAAAWGVEATADLLY